MTLISHQICHTIKNWLSTIPRVHEVINIKEQSTRVIQLMPQQGFSPLTKSRELHLEYLRLVRGVGFLFCDSLRD